MPAMRPARPANNEQYAADRSRIGRAAGIGTILPELWRMLFVCAWLAAIHDRGRRRSRSHSRLACRGRLVRHAMQRQPLLGLGGRGRDLDLMHDLRRTARCLPGLRSRRRGMHHGAVSVRPARAHALKHLSRGRPEDAANSPATKPDQRQRTGTWPFVFPGGRYRDPAPPGPPPPPPFSPPRLPPPLRVRGGRVPPLAQPASATAGTASAAKVRRVKSRRRSDMGRSIHAPLRKGWRRSPWMWELDRRCATIGRAGLFWRHAVLPRTGGARPAIVAMLVVVAAAELRWPCAASGAGGAAGDGDGRHGQRPQNEKLQQAASLQYAVIHHAPSEIPTVMCM